MGVSFSLEPHIAFYAAQKNTKAIQDIISTALTYLLLLSLLILAIVFLLGKPILDLLIKDAQSGIPEYLLLAAYPAIVANILLFVFMCIPRGFQRFDISSKIQISGKVIFAVSLLVFLQLKSNIYALLGSFTLQSYVILIIYIFAAKSIAPSIRFFKLGISFPMLKKMMNFGYKIQVSSFSFLMTMYFDKMLLASFFGLTYAGYYEAITRIIYAVRDVPIFLMSVLTPRISELYSQKNYEAIIIIYKKITKQLSAFSFVLMILML
jgi:O-antigen/teichoic acid export membrane protein